MNYWSSEEREVGYALLIVLVVLAGLTLRFYMT